MPKSLFIAEKPSVAQEFAKALKVSGSRFDGYIESSDTIVTWCVGHLVTMSYPEEYDPKMKKWSLETLPFLPKEYKYQVIDGVKKQFQIVSGLLNRKDVDTIYVCTDSGREGEYIYRLVEQMAGVKGKIRKRVWIDSQTEEEILKGIKNAKDLSSYDNLAAAAYLRAKEDYLMGINFSRVLTLRYGPLVSHYLNTKWTVLSVGRVMTCVLGMVVRREREIREFVKTPFYRVLGQFQVKEQLLEGEWRVVEGSAYFQSPALYKENGWKKEKDARKLIEELEKWQDGMLHAIEKKKENKNPPLLYNLAEIQNDCSKLFKISPDAALTIIQELYEKKMVTYPRTDARVLSSAVAKEIDKNIRGLKRFFPMAAFADEVLANGSYKNIAKTRYVNDKQITDHYAIIPTGQGLGAYASLSQTAQKIYQLICSRFLSIFYPAAVYQKISLEIIVGKEHFFSSYRVLTNPGYFKVSGIPKNAGDTDATVSAALFETLKTLKKGMKLPIHSFSIKEGETSPPKRYNSGSMILAMENAGQLIEDEELRAQIKGSGIGTSATRAEILKKLVSIQYLELNKKTQMITPTLLGEIVFDVVSMSMRQLLNPELTASWEKGLTYVAEGTITPQAYMEKLERFVAGRTLAAGQRSDPSMLRHSFDTAASYYKVPKKQGKEGKYGKEKQRSNEKTAKEKERTGNETGRDED